MPGHNHFADCTCGWCIGGWRNHDIERTRFVGPTAMAQRWPAAGAVFESYVDPNAVCPVCGAQVFFYRSPYDGRVFFDELGPPWPKHPCTDNQLSLSHRIQSIAPKILNQTRDPDWRKHGWIPVKPIQSVLDCKEWLWIKFKRLDSKTVFTRAVRKKANVQWGAPMLMTPLDSFGVGQLAWLRTAEGETFGKRTGIYFRGYAATRFSDVKDALNDKMKQITEVGFRISLAWVDRDKAQPPTWMDWSFGRAWLQRAAAAGTGTAPRQS